jgi:hypothetical protein
LLFALRKLPRRRMAARGIRHGRHGDPPVFRIYAKTLSRLAALGFARRPEETPHEYLARTQSEGLKSAAALAHLTEYYAKARYGDIKVPDEVVRRLRSEAVSIGKDA